LPAFVGRETEHIEIEIAAQRIVDPGHDATEIVGIFDVLANEDANVSRYLEAP
jgi:hypothetical protein